MAGGDGAGAGAACTVACAAGAATAKGGAGVGATGLTGAAGGIANVDADRLKGTLSMLIFWG